MKNRFGVSLWTEELIMMIYDPEGIAKDYLKQMLKSQIKENYRLVKNTGIQIGLFEKERFTKKV